MFVDLDPDLWLFSRLSVRRHWRMLLVILFGVLVLAAHELVAGANADPQLFVSTMFFVMAAACAPASAVAALEGDGLLDSMRLAGRPPHRLALALVAGLTWPYAVVAVALFWVERVYLRGPTVGLELILVFAGALTVALFVLAWMPGRGSPVAVMGGTVFLAGVANATIASHSWIVALRYDRWTAELTTGAGTHAVPAAIAVAMALPVAVYAASRRLVRPRLSSSRKSAALFSRLTHLVGGERPPEALRTLRSNLVAAVFLALLLGSVLVALIVARRLHSPWMATPVYSGFMTALPFVAVVIGGLMAMSAASREVEAGTLDLVRITPQRPEAIVFGWYFGPAVPMWIVALVLVAVFRIGAPDAFADVGPRAWAALVVVSLLVPAVCLADCLHDGVGGGLLASACAALFLFVPAADSVRDTSTLPPSFQAWGLNIVPLLPAMVLVVALGAACGRIRRPHGPALEGPAAAAAIAAAVFALRLAPPAIFPRAVVGFLPVLAVFLFRDRRAMGGTVPRVALLMIASAVAVFAAAFDAGAGTADSLMTAACAALALGAGVLALEAAPPKAAIAAAASALSMAIAFRAAALYGLFRNRLPETPSALEVRDAVTFGVAFLFMAAAYWRVSARGRV